MMEMFAGGGIALLGVIFGGAIALAGRNNDKPRDPS